jgi:hypothetical protein
MAMGNVELVDSALLYWATNARKNGIGCDIIVGVLDGHYTTAELDVAKQILLEKLHVHHTENHSNTTQYNHDDPLRDIARRRQGNSAKLRTTEDIVEMLKRPCIIDATFSFANTDHAKLPPVSPLTGEVDSGAMLRQLRDLRQSVQELQENNQRRAAHQQHQVTPQQPQTAHNNRRNSLRNQQQPPALPNPQNDQPPVAAARPTYAAVANAPAQNQGATRRATGTARATALQASRPVIRVVATKLAPNETPANIKAYLSSLTSFSTDVEITVEMLQSRYPTSYSTAKITFAGSVTEENVYDESIWPERVWVHQYNAPRRQPAGAAAPLGNA